MRIADAPVTLDATDRLYQVYRYLRSPAKNPHIDQNERDDLKRRYLEVLRRPEHGEAVRTALSAAAGVQFNIAVALAKPYNLEATTAVRDRLIANPSDLYLWQWFVASPDLDRVRAGVSLAEEILPLETLANGPSATLGFGRQFEMDEALGYVVSRLTPVPELGWKLIRTALSNRVVGTRRAAIGALESRPFNTWPTDLIEIVRELEWRDPDANTRTTARSLLAAIN
jgi:hypothetical protein